MQRANGARFEPGDDFESERRDSPGCRPGGDGGCCHQHSKVGDTDAGPKSGRRACFFLGALSTGLFLSIGCFGWHLAVERDSVADPWLCHYQGAAYSLGSVITMAGDVAKACQLVDGVPIWDH